MHESILQKGDSIVVPAGYTGSWRCPTKELDRPPKQQLHIWLKLELIEQTDDYIAQAIKAGAKGYLPKNMPVEELAQSIRLVYRGYSLIGPGLREKMFDSIVNSKSDTDEKPKFAELTPREIDFTWEAALQAANTLMFIHTGEYLSDLETIILHGAWNNDTYKQIAEAKGYTSSYLCRDIGCKLWENLSIALKVKVSKTNFKAALKREWQKYTQAIFSQNRNRLAKLLTTENITLFEGLLALGSTLYLERYVPLAKNIALKH